MATILVADDNRPNREALAALLEAAGHEVIRAADGREALSRAQEARPELVISDVLMPVMDGYELARRVRKAEADGKLKRTPIVACTANALRGEDATCRAAGMDDYLCKPIELAVLEGKLARWLPLP